VIQPCAAETELNKGMESGFEPEKSIEGNPFGNHTRLLREITA